MQKKNITEIDPILKIRKRNIKDHPAPQGKKNINKKKKRLKEKVEIEISRKRKILLLKKKNQLKRR